MSVDLKSMPGRKRAEGEVPVLYWNSGQSCNWPDWSKRFHAKMQRVYPLSGAILEDGRELTFQNLLEEATACPTPMLQQSLFDNYVKVKQQHEVAKRSMWSDLLELLSEESALRVTFHADFGAALSQRCPLLLFSIVKAVHIVAGSSALISASLARTKWYELLQGSMSIEDYFKEAEAINASLESLDTAGKYKIPDQTMALDSCLKMSGIYLHQCKVWFAKGDAEVPTTWASFKEKMRRCHDIYVTSKSCKSATPAPVA